MSDSLEQIAREVSVCTNCPLHQGRTHAVPGDGPPQADIMFIGEGPGFHEDRQGLPFVGNAGQFLEQMLASIGLKRSDVYITNVVKCRPPNNRDPMPDEIEACRSYLERQITLINPKVIVTLGRFSMARWFPTARISKIHGQARRIGERMIVPFFHPAAALHQPSLREIVEQDFLKLPQFVEQYSTGIEEAPPDVGEEPPDEDEDGPVQLSLF